MMNDSRRWLARLLAAASVLATLAVAPMAAAQGGASPAGADKVKTLRSEGAVNAADIDIGDVFKVERDRPPLPRDFVQQPPLIPHTTRGYTVTLNFNKCMDCHAWSRARETGATKVSLTHFRDRDATELPNISPRRYFCLQCHVSQTDAKPLVENTFRSAQGLK
jgi:cytochrome c-type protein NapB